MSVLSASLHGTRRLMVGLGQYGLLLGPVRRALVEPGAEIRDELLRLLLCHYGKLLWQQGLNAGCAGNLSARARQEDAIYITPRGANKARLSVSEIERVSLRGLTDQERERVSVEYPMHRACYVADVYVGAVIHTHAPYLTALGLGGVDIGDALPETAAALGGILRVPFAPSGSELLGERVVDALNSGARLLMLERHGALAVGRDLAEAYDRMELGELSAKTALLARGIAAAA